MQKQQRFVVTRSLAVLVVWLTAIAAQSASPLYVVNGGVGGGTSWGDAMDLPAAVAAATTRPTMVYIKADTFTVSSEMVMSGRDVTLDGGYAGAVGTPGSKAGSPTIIQAGTTNRLFNISASTVTVDTVTMRDGDMQTLNQSFGGAMIVADSTVTLTNCSLLNNRVFGGGGALQGGGAIYADNGELFLYDCTVINNTCLPTVNSLEGRGGAIYMINGGKLLFDGCTVATNSNFNNGQRYVSYHGGALYCDGTDVTMLDSAFVGNWTGNGSPDDSVFSGGVLSLLNGTLGVTNCEFTGNWAQHTGSGTPDRGNGEGGVFYLSSITSASISDSTFLRNRSLGSDSKGGILHLLGGGDVMIDTCLFASNGVSGDNGGIRVDAGSLRIYNSLFAHTDGGNVSVPGSLYNTNAITCFGGVVGVTNVTMVDGKGWGLVNMGGTVGVQNAIAWGNAGGGISTNPGDVVNYTLSQEPHGGTGNLNVDPLFAPGLEPYHLRGASPAVNQGFTEDWMRSGSSLDLAGYKRAVSNVDMGCYERQNPKGTLVLLE